MGLIVDLFAGGGGASTGIEWATGRSPDIAINHDRLALAMHQANHPNTRHLVENVWNVRPRAIVGDQPVEILWASPDCTHFSKAKGAAPKRDVNRAKRSRGLAWVILRWAREARPTLIFMENVEEWWDWCHLRKDGTIDPKRKGQLRRKFVRELEKLGYAVHIERKDRACDHGAPTIRQRLFMVARCDALPIRRPEPTHGPKRDGDLFGAALKPYRTAAEIIDWSIPCPSIFTRKKELATATKRRIARGMKRYVIDAARPFIVPITHHGDTRVHGIDAPELAQQCKLDTTCVPCGLYAREELKRLVLGKRVTCRPTAISYDRVVARCRVGKVDVDLAMIAAGQAIAYRKYLEDEDLAVYVETEDEAREEKRGIWGMSFVPPAEWRHNNARLECERR